MIIIIILSLTMYYMVMEERLECYFLYVAKLDVNPNILVSYLLLFLSNYCGVVIFQGFRTCAF